MCVTSLLQDFYTHEAQPDVPFLLPALELQPEELWEICEGTPFVLNKPMSRGRFLEVLRGTMFQCGLDPQSA